jgi:hypothetical protein
MGVPTSAEIQKARSSPHASLGRGPEVQQQRVVRMIHVNRLQSAGNAAQNYRQFVVEILRGCGGYGAGVAGIGEVFHGCMLPRQFRREPY